MRVTAIIPTREGDGGPVPRLVAALLALRDARLRIVVGIDGHAVPRALEPLIDDPALTVTTGEHGGPGAARNRAIQHADGDLVLFLNDDVTPAPDLIDRHRAAHADGATRLVLGGAPFAISEPDRVLDRMTRETSLLFFYDTMDTRDPDHDWGFRHAWTLNLSLPRAACEPFDAGLTYPMFDDLEWAYRVTRSHDAPVVYRPGARVTHHHRYEPQQILQREALLGHQALALHGVNPECARTVFGARFDGSPASAEEARALVAAEASETYTHFETVAVRPAMQANVHELFAAARPWRMAARAAGYLAALDGEAPPSANAIFPNTVRA